MVVIVIAGITGQGADISAEAAAGADRLRGWLTDLGVNSSSAAGATSTAKSAAPNVISTLVHGIVNGIRGLASVLFGLSFAALGTFFLLKDGPQMRQLARPPRRTSAPGRRDDLQRLDQVAARATSAASPSSPGSTASSWDSRPSCSECPLAGTIAVVSFVTAYVPYIGAIVAGAFAVLLALGSQGTGVAIAMLVIVILANGLLQNLVQPFAMGSALHLNPLIVLVVTIGAGCLFGMLGLVLAAPLVSAAVQIAKELNQPLGAQTKPDPEPPPPAGDALIRTG